MTITPPDHGGRLRAAAEHWEIPVAQWLDLSTGINPDSWPVPPIPEAVWRRLPEDEDGLEDAIREWSGVGCRASCVPVAGSQAAIQALADSVGIRYKALPNKTEQFAHPAAIVFLSGSGTITRYFTTLAPASGNLRTALVEASNGTVGTIIDKAFLACARFDPDSNSYSASAFKIMRYGSIFMALLMGAALFVFWRREKQQLETAQEEGIDAMLSERT